MLRMGKQKWQIVCLYLKAELQLLQLVCEQAREQAL